MTIQTLTNITTASTEVSDFPINKFHFEVQLEAHPSNEPSA